MRSCESLKQLQSLPIDLKIALSKDRIRQWVNEFGESGCFISFSGGKDSTVLLHLVRSLYPDIKAVFFDSGLEFPENRSFVKSFDNVLCLKPKYNFRDVILKFGYPFISKEVSQKVYEFRNGASYRKKNFDGSLKGFLGDCSSYSFLLDSPYKFSHKCCYYLKKSINHRYINSSGSFPFVGTLACESLLRRSNWIRYGCNSFNLNYPRSAPLSFWTEQDILHYLRDFNLSFSSCYGDILIDYSSLGVPDGQLSFFNSSIPLKCSGCSRTGCMYCGFGCHLHNDSRFLYLRDHYPNIYDYVFRPLDKGGLGYRDVIDWLNDNGNLDIRY